MGNGQKEVYSPNSSLKYKEIADKEGVNHIFAIEVKLWKYEDTNVNVGRKVRQSMHICKRKVCIFCLPDH